MRTLITNARLIDGTGSPAFEGEILLEDQHIAEVGKTTLTADHVINAHGMVVAPGFIDMHSHSDFTLPQDPTAHAKIMQGITTEVVGNCGLGVMPSTPRVDEMYDKYAPMIFGEASSACSPTLDEYRARLSANGISVNAACLIPHGNIRCAAMGMAERAPTADEMTQMREQIDQTMAQGAFGFSTGLVYPPGAFATFEEISELAKVIKPYGGFYASHIRDEGSRLVESISEALRIGETAGVGVQISHHKAAGIFNWGKVKRTLAMVDEARARGMDVHSDVYPYTAGSTILSSLILPLWVFDGTVDEMISKMRDPETRARIVKESQERLLKMADLKFPLTLIPKSWVMEFSVRLMRRLVVISSMRHQHEYEGMTLKQAAAKRKQPLYEAVMDLLIEEETAIATIVHVMSERDVQTVMKHPATMIGTDGFPLRNGKPHPRTFGTYPRVIEHYVGKLKLFPLEEAVHRMTGLPAQKLKLKKRGVLARGAHADVVVFDPNSVRDRATYLDPKRAPLGIPHVFVNGAWTVKNGVHTGARAGSVLRRGDA